MSAGQRQRIGLARAVVRSRPFLGPRANRTPISMLTARMRLSMRSKFCATQAEHRHLAPAQCFGGAEHGHGHLWRPGDRFRTARGCICARRAAGKLCHEPLIHSRSGPGYDGADNVDQQEAALVLELRRLQIFLDEERDQQRFSHAIDLRCDDRPPVPATRATPLCEASRQQGSNGAAR